MYPPVPRLILSRTSQPFMTNKRIRPENYQDSQSQAQLELLEALLLTDVTYPWNPASPESETYLAALEQEFVLEDWPADEVEARSQGLYTQLEQLWPVANTGSESMQPLSALGNELQQQFAAYLPASWLDSIANQAQHLLSSNLSVAEKLVHCVQQLLPHWAEEDLQVLARPIAYAMRGSEVAGVESTLTGTPPVPWTELSEIEQARITLAVARYALTKLQTEK